MAAHLRRFRSLKTLLVLGILLLSAWLVSVAPTFGPLATSGSQASSGAATAASTPGSSPSTPPSSPVPPQEPPASPTTGPTHGSSGAVAGPLGVPPSPPSTSINGSVHVNGTFAAGTTYLAGDVHILGSAVTQNLTQTAGWAEYGPTMVNGSMRITSLPGSSDPIFASHGGSDLHVQPLPANTTAFDIMEGNIQLGNSGTGDTYLMTSAGVNITVDADQAGGFYSYGGGTNIVVGNASQILNYANSSGPLTIQCTIPFFCPTAGIKINPGVLYVSAYCIVLLGCFNVSVSSITWPAGSHFTILGSTTSSGQGMTATLPDSRMDISVPEGAGVTLAMSSDLGAPQLSVSPGATYPALVATHGQVTVSRGEALNASVTVQGTFSANQIVENGGTFYNNGGLTIQGELDSTGEQVFQHKLQLGPDISIVTAPGGSVVSTGSTSINDDVSILGSTEASGDLTIHGVMTQNATLIHIQGNLSLNGSLIASGAVGTSGTTQFTGNVSSSGAITLPHSSLDGNFTLTGGTFVGLGSTVLTGTSVGHGWTWVNASTYAVVGSAWLNGTVVVNRSITVTGAAELLTAPGGSLRLNATVLMGAGSGTAPWTSRVQGSLWVRGASFANGTSSFNGTTVSFPSGLKVVGNVEAQGNVSVVGVTAFAGAVTTQGSAQFPGMSLTGTFGLSSASGSVNGTGTSGVAGNVSLSGTLTVAHGVFAEAGSSVIEGDLTMGGSVLVSGNSTLSTAPGTTLSLVGNIDLAGAAHIVGNVNTTGNVTISGSASLSSSAVTISGSLQATGTVYSRGSVELTGTADFQGPVDTLGRTDLPGISVAGNYTLRTGEFRLAGTIDLTGYTVSQGTILADSNGYFVQGPSRIVGHTVATGSVGVWGPSLTVGYVNLGNGATLAGYMQVNGGMSVGGIALSGTMVLPNDTATFPQGANVTGSIFQTGELTSSGGAMSFYGTTFVNGTVVSQGTPSLQGPIIVPLLGSPFALSLGPEVFLLLSGFVLLVLILGIEFLRVGWKYRTPFPLRERKAVRKLWHEPLLSATLFAAGTFTVAIGGFALGGYLLTPSHVSSAGSVVDVYVAGAVLLLLGCVLWLHHRWRYTQVRKQVRRASAPKWGGGGGAGRAPPPPPFAPPFEPPWGPVRSIEPTTPPMGAPPSEGQGEGAGP